MVNLIENDKLYLPGSLVVVKNGVLKTNPYLFEIQVQRLTIKNMKVLQHFNFQNVSLSDSGTYRCVAGNVLGETSVSVRLVVNSVSNTVASSVIKILVLIHVLL